MEKERGRKLQEIFQNRSSTKEFLLSKTDLKTAERPVAQASLPDSDLLVNLYPDLPTGQAFIDTAMDRLASASEFSVMVIRLDAFGFDRDPSEIDLVSLLTAIAKAISEICVPEKDIWGQLNRAEFACFFPGENSLFCLKKAEKLKQKLAADQNETISIGIAAFPTTTYERMQILGNAYKALKHAEFFGPGSVVSFDSTSLNISGDAFYQNGDVKGAIREYKQALLLDPENVNVYNSLGVCYGVMEAFDKALEEFQTAISLDPGEVMALYNAGLVNTMIDDNESALQYFLKADSLGNDVFELALHTGKLYCEMGEHSRGIEFLNKALKLNPESGPAHRYKGVCYAAMNNSEEAIAAFTKAIKVNPNDAVALSGLGYLYGLEDKELEIATAFCRQSVQISPENGLFRYRLGNMYLKQNRLEEALTELNTAEKMGHTCTELIEEIQSRLSAKVS